jgi:hypothetical protein
LKKRIAERCLCTEAIDAYHLKHVDTIFRRVFGDAAIPQEKRDELAAQ